MRKRIQQLAVFVLALTAAPSLTAGDGADAVHWYSDIQQASAAAREANRPMILDFWADWCAACRVMEAEVYTSSDFAAATQRLIPVRIDFDKKQDLARKYNITALPMILFTDSYGTELFRLRGYVSAKMFLDVVRALPADVSEFNRLTRILAEGKNNFKALKSMGDNLRTAGLFLASNDYYSKALQRNDARSNATARAAILTEMGSNYLQLKQAKQAADTFEKCLKEFPASPKRAQWTLNLGKAFAAGEKRLQAKARKVLEELIRDYPSSAESEEGKRLLVSQPRL
ncbi:MAG: thioredoxin family protein [Acidobacteria bacterium]|nr:thioredoxin family protein [Acidobacteriota bacterium]